MSTSRLSPVLRPNWTAGFLFTTALTSLTGFLFRLGPCCQRSIWESPQWWCWLCDALPPPPCLEKNFPAGESSISNFHSHIFTCLSIRIFCPTQEIDLYYP